MEVKTHQYSQNQSWINTPDPSLDTENTLFILLDSSDTTKVSNIILELKKIYSHRLNTDCSISGEMDA